MDSLNSRRSASGLIAGLGILMGILVGLFEVNLPDPARDLFLAYILIGGIFAVGLIPILLDIKNRTFELLHPTTLFVMYYLVILGLAPLYVMLVPSAALESFRLDDLPNKLFYTIGLGFALLGLICFVAGTKAQIGSRWGKRLPSFGPWQVHRARGLVGVLVLTGVVAAYELLAGGEGGLSAFLNNLAHWRTVDLIGEGYLIYPASGLLTTAALLWFIVKVDSRTDQVKVLLYLSLFFVSCIPSVLLGFRVALIPPILQMLAIWHYRRRKISIRSLTVIVVLFVLFLAVYGSIREKIETAGVSNLGLAGNPESNSLETLMLRVRGGDMVAIVIGRLHETGKYMYGFRSVTEALTILVPRRLWKDKPEPTGLEFGREFMGDLLLARGSDLSEGTGGFSPTAIGYFYWQFGWIGVLAGMFLLGVVARATRVYFDVNRQDRSRLFIYTTIMATFPFFAETPQDGLNTLVIRCGFMLVLLIGLTIRIGSPLGTRGYVGSRAGVR